jgi:DNA-directed RNA polymerase subunit RPC12/RpoP
MDREPSDFRGVWCPECGAALTEHRLHITIEAGKSVACPYCRTVFVVKGMIKTVGKNDARVEENSKKSKRD